MKILFLAEQFGTRALETYDNGVGNQLVFWVNDTLSPDLFQDLINIHGRPDTVISTAHPEYPVDNINWYFWCDDLLNHSLGEYNIFPLETQYCFNFSIRKSKINRTLLLKLVDWYGLKSYDYTWQGENVSVSISESIIKDVGSVADIVPELDLFAEHLRSSIVNIDSKFYNPTIGAEETKSAWDSMIGQMVSSSAVSLISESVDIEPAINFTEKTIYSVLGLTFPIWIGGVRPAHWWTTLGFDTFDDVICHDYQNCNTLLERCVRAFHDNQKILTNLEFATDLRNKHMDRLLNNRKIMRQQFNTHYHKTFNSMPQDLQQALTQMIRDFGPNQRNYQYLNLGQFK
jgi:hypothetical protein